MNMKRLFSILLAVVLLVAAIPAAGLIPTAQAAEIDDHLEYALFPMDILDINRTNNKNLGYAKHTDQSSHQYHYSFDFGGSDRTLEAPFTLRLISTGGDHSVIFESVNKVRLANGEVDYLTCMFTHDNNISDLVKKNNRTNDVFYQEIIAQGTAFYNQGTYRNVDRHVHIEIARGRVCSKSKTFDANLAALRSDSCGIQVQDALYVKTSTKLTDHNDLNWRVVSEVTFNDNAGHTLVRYYPAGTTYSTLPAPTKADRKFLGWYTQKTGGSKVTATTTVPKNKQTLYAQWDKAELTAPFTWGALAVSPVTETNANLKTVVLLKKLPNSLKSGYYIGTNPNFLTKGNKDKTNGNRLYYLPLSFDLNKCGDTLLPGTTYYYQLYVTVNGTEYRSSVSSFTTPAPKLETTWSNLSAGSITQTNATIQGKVTYGKTVNVQRCGFYFGTSEKNLTKSAKVDTVNASRQYSNISYNLNKSGHTLKAGTTYYYQFYAVVDNTEYKSPVKSFTTKAATTQKPATNTTSIKPAWSNLSAGSITQTNATIQGKVTYGKTVKVQRCGFYFGTSEKNLTKSAKVDTVNASRQYSNISYNLSKSGHTLKAGTTYYYQFYVVVDGKEYKSPVKTFTTTAAAMQKPTTTETSLNPVWSNCSADSITPNSATIQGKVTYGKAVIPERCGFYIGTSKDNLAKAAKYDVINSKREYSNISYDLSKADMVLYPATTYYYQFYVIVDGKEYTSAVNSFTSQKAPLSVTWSNCSASSITKTNATIKGKATYGKTVTPERCGFYIGTSEDTLVKAEKYDTINANRTYSNMSYGLNKYGQTLKAGTTYYYQFYVIVDGVEYRSPVKSFKTSA